MIAIYEPLYFAGQELTEPAFCPLRLDSNAHAEWREFRIIVDMYQRGLHRHQRYTGLFSPKFNLKTGVSGDQFLDFVRANSDADVCFINPFPQLAYISFNVWMQGEASHPGLIERGQALLNASAIDWSLDEIPRHNPKLLSYCNFWVGTEAFWNDYVGGVLLPIYKFLDLNSESPVTQAALASTFHSDPAPFLPFVVERLFSSFLSLHQSKIKTAAYPQEAFRSCLTDFERDVVSLTKSDVDAADSGGQFPDSLKRNMALLCRLWTKFNWAYYSDRPHPHTGMPLRPSQLY